ncbi:multiple sugar ABC transporter [Gracilibacillus boraciitolerans JCM 21714]|uniref:Multiple sugar ABC transporter n=1 Tax=Gracilibacillus boraciitolerans JCM 21714 TaxID=1298598 RepID=W4VI76_9BACI|nr:carbohydrate ABC transporter permease [Gracilibacillus boraciitolerans]GAE93110.1 multiple sugar ABC transporter [Gracilibacillus boraciitolerans JCM 21714]
MNDEKRWQIYGHVVMIILSVLAIVPFVLLIIASLTDEAVILAEGYSFFPSELSLEAYKYLWNMNDIITRAYGVTLFITAFGTVISLVITSLLAYPLSRKDLPYKNLFAFLVFFTLLFNGGLVPTYFVYTQVFDLKNTIWALIIPIILTNGFNVLLMRTFFKESVPDALIESARIDGAGEWRTLWSVVLPLATPIMATIGLFQAVIFWNDWMNGLVFLTDTRLYSLQVLLNRILEDIQFLRTADLGGQASDAMANLPSASIRMAIAAIGVIPMLIAYPFFQKYLKKGIALGGVKG